MERLCAAEMPGHLGWNWTVERSWEGCQTVAADLAAGAGEAQAIAGSRSLEIGRRCSRALFARDRLCHPHHRSPAESAGRKEAEHHQRQADAERPADAEM